MDKTLSEWGFTMVPDDPHAGFDIVINGTELVDLVTTMPKVIDGTIPMYLDGRLLEIRDGLPVGWEYDGAWQFGGDSQAELRIKGDDGEWHPVDVKWWTLKYGKSGAARLDLSVHSRQL